MLSSLISLLACAGFAGDDAAGPGGPTGPRAAPAAGFHQIAFVTDTLSHGQLGDGYLSLNEAIQLHNGTLLVSQLSTAEQQQVTALPGSLTSDITWIDIDSEAVPTITVQQDLDTIVNTPYGLFLRGEGGRVTLDLTAPGLTRGLHSTSSSLSLQGLRFLGGVSGLDVVQADATGQPGCVVIDCVFENLATFGVRVAGTQPGGVGRLILEDCRFVNVQDACSFDDTPADRNTIFEARDVTVAGAADGFDFDVGVGGTARFTLDRCSVTCTGVGVDLTAAATNGRPMLVEGTHLRVRAPFAARIDGATDAVTWMQCSMWHLLAPAGGTALALGALGDQVYGDLRELRCTGDVTIAAGGAPLPLRVRNARCRDGAVTLSTGASQALEVTESRFSNCTTESAGGGQVLFDGCSFEAGTVGLASPSGSMQATNCFVPGSGAGMTATGSLPQAQLGSMEVFPDDAQLGGTISFQMDLPAGLVGVFALGTVPLSVPTLPAPYYIYADPASLVFLPGFYSGQQSTSWQVPPLIAFFGAQLIVQSAVLPVAAPAPFLQLPPGWLFEVR